MNIERGSRKGQKPKATIATPVPIINQLFWIVGKTASGMRYLIYQLYNLKCTTVDIEAIKHSSIYELQVVVVFIT